MAVGAVLLDLALGDPPNSVHPVAWMGKLIGFLDRRVRRTGRVARDRAFGVLVAIVPILVFVALYVVVLALVRNYIGALAWAVVGLLLLKSLFAIRTLGDHVYPVMDALQKGDLETARRKVQMVVSRDTSKLDAGHVASCAVETVAENAVDSVFSPFLFLGLAGIPGAVFYRVSNTLDAMVGYLTDRHRSVGWFSAKLDDVLNYLGARVSVPFILLALAMMGKDWRAAWRTAKRDRRKTASPNKGWPMATFAGGLGITMEKSGYYTFGDGPLPEDPRSIQEAVALMKGSSLLFFFLVALPTFLMLGVQVQLLLEDWVIQLL
ncbi:MAG TPA: cobalamin biosynthesis protein [Methanomassiliicoccales archaeon]|nr:cobalamin biosynthesis protein [Methanomassiliicoccales archaeon]